MSNHPLNLALRFLLELFGLFSFGYWGWTKHTGWLRILLAVGAPLLAATAWGLFRVPGDIGKTPIPVGGMFRLLLEMIFFGASVWALFAAGRPAWAWIYGVLIIIHYGISYDRIIWLLRQK
jgi:hypothetical protein